MLRDTTFKPFSLFFSGNSFSRAVTVAELSVSEELLPPSVKAESTKPGFICMGQLDKSLVTTTGSLSEGTGTTSFQQLEDLMCWIKLCASAESPLRF